MATEQEISAARTRYSDWDTLTPEEQDQVIALDRSEGLLDAPMQEREAPGWTPSRQAQSVNQGLVNVANAPMELLSGMVNQAFGTDLPAPGAADLQAATNQLGITAPEGERLEGVPGTAGEIFGSSLPFFLTLLRTGQLSNQARNLTPRVEGAVRSAPTGMSVADLTPGGVTSQVIQAFKSAPGFMARETAKRPLAAAGGEITGSLGAAAGGEAAEAVSPDNRFLGELLGGITLPMSVGLTPKLAKWAGEKIFGGLSSFTRPGAERAAARDLQGRSVNPELDEAAIDPESLIPPAMQTESPRLWETQQLALEKGPPQLQERMDTQLKQATDKAMKDAVDFEGDEAAVRAAIEEPADQLVQNLNRRADEALQEAQATMRQMEGTATPREISRAGRKKITESLSAERAQENELWSDVTRDAEGNYKNIRNAFDEEMARRSSNDDPAEIPAYLREAFKKEEKLTELAAKAAKGEQLSEAEAKFLAEESITLNDVHALRKRVGRDLFEEVVKDAPNRNKIRILNDFRDALLEDMSAVDAEGVDNAIAFSKQLNDKFTKGEIGKLLGTDRSGVARVDDPATFETILGEKSASRGIRQLLEGTPNAQADLEDFVRSRFILQATNDQGVLNQRTADRLIRDLRDRGVFEELPGLEAELQNAVKQTNRAENLSRRAEIVQKRGGARLEKGSNESLASVFLKKPVGQEMDVLLEQKDPARAVQLARRLRSRLEGNPAAEQGAKLSFARRLLEQGRTGKIDPNTGEKVVSGAAYTRLVNTNTETMRALGFSDDEIQRLKQAATALRQAQRNISGNTVKNLTEGMPSRIIDLLSTWAGARAGGQLANTMGSSLVMARFGSENMKNVVMRILRDKPGEVMTEAIFDPELFKSLLVRGTDPLAKQEKAARVLKSWLLGAGVEDLSEDQNSSSSGSPSSSSPSSSSP